MSFETEENEVNYNISTVVSCSFGKRIKNHCMLKGISIRKFIVAAIDAALKAEDDQQLRRDLAKRRKREEVAAKEGIEEAVSNLITDTRRID